MARADPDRRFLLEAVALADRGRFAVEPNPPVGCVIVRRGRVVGRGFHRAYGGPHAEVEALRAAGGRARGATAYVSLEPCTTEGKTPPCVGALRKAGLARIVWAAPDPNPAHAGKAAAALRRVGVSVRPAAARAEGARLLPRFRASLGLDRPWVVLKWAMSLDGRIAPRRGATARLTGPDAWRWLHDLRGRVEAVAVGAETVLVDDPRLDCRIRGGPPEGRPQPTAVVFDSRLRIPPDSALVRGASPARPLLVFATRPPAKKAAALANRPGVEVVTARAAPDGRVDLAAAFTTLFHRGVRRLLVEGGSVLGGALLRAGLVDQIAAIVVPRLLGGETAPPALSATGFDDLLSAPHLEGFRARRLGADVLLEAFVAR